MIQLLPYQARNELLSVTPHCRPAEKSQLIMRLSTAVMSAHSRTFGIEHVGIVVHPQRTGRLA